MKEWILAYWWMIWMLIVALAFVGHGIRQRDGRGPGRKFQQRISNQAVLRQLAIVATGLIVVAITLLIVRLF